MQKISLQKDTKKTVFYFDGVYFVDRGINDFFSENIKKEKKESIFNITQK